MRLLPIIFFLILIPSVYSAEEVGSAYLVDDIPPNLTLIEPLNKSYPPETTSLELKYVVSDNVAIDKCWFYLDNKRRDLPNCENVSFTVTQGSHKLVLYVNDTSGNLNSATVYFEILGEVASLFPPGFNLTAYAKANIEAEPKSVYLKDVPLGHVKFKIKLISREKIPVGIMVNTILETKERFFWLMPNEIKELEFEAFIDKKCITKKYSITLFIRKGRFTIRKDVPVTIKSVCELRQEVETTGIEISKLKGYVIFLIIAVLFLIFLLVKKRSSKELKGTIK